MININDKAAWQVLLQQSSDQAVIIFKHSNICPASAITFRNMVKAIEQGTIAEVYLVVVQASREVSDQIAKDLEVRHESPQVIVVKNGQAIYDASHRAINPGIIKGYVG